MKRIAIIIVALLITATLAGCGNYQLLYTTYHFNRAIVLLQNGEVIEGAVQNWKDYEEGMVRVKIDGITYLVHSSNITLISE